MRIREARELERLVFLVLVALLFAWAAWEAQSFPDRARIFPQIVALAALVLAGAAIVRAVLAWRRARDRAVAAGAGPAAQVREASEVRGEPGGAEVSEARLPPEARTFVRQLAAGARYLLWIAALYVAIYLAGFVPAAAAFVFLFLVVEARARWYAALGAALILAAGLLVLGAVLNLSWPEAVVL